MRGMVVFAALSVLLSAGCLSDLADGGGAAEPVGSTADVFAFRDAGGYTERTSLPRQLASTTLHPLGFATVEPSIAATSDGSLFVIANEDVLRSQDEGAT